MPSKLNWMISNTAPGMLVSQSWLSKNGISPSLASCYKNSQWLDKISVGLYVRPGRPAQWQDVLACLQNQTQLPVRLCGLSSLAYQGRSHYLNFSAETIWLAVEKNTRLPAWFHRMAEHNQYMTANSKLTHVIEKDLLPVDVKGQKVLASILELAILEVLETVPKQVSFEHAAQLFQGLVNLRPRRLQSLLERNSSVKSNRLFLFFAHYYQHPWLKRLDEDKIKLGSGKRQIVKGGGLEKRYLITVPEKYCLEQENG